MFRIIGRAISLARDSKTTLNNFIKTIHPDHHTNASPDIIKTNSNALKELNQYIEKVHKNAGVDKITLQFYIKADKYQQASVELLSIKPNVSPTLKEMHLSR